MLFGFVCVLVCGRVLGWGRGPSCWPGEGFGLYFWEFGVRGQVECPLVLCRVASAIPGSVLARVLVCAEAEVGETGVGGQSLCLSPVAIFSCFLSHSTALPCD